jgi:Bacterial Ig-like domain (group 2)
MPQRMVWLLLIVPLLLAVPSAAQTDNRGTLSLAVDPPHLTLSVGQEQRFSAQMKGAPASAAIVWAVREHGASVSQDGIFTARVVGIYHVIALVVGHGTIFRSAVAKVTVVAQYDGPGVL